MSTSTATETVPTPVKQLRLPGQAAAPEGPVDLTIMYLMHHAFRRDLQRFVAAITHTPVTERATWQAITLRWERFGEILHHHHTIEDDQIWPVLRERGTDADREHLDAMEAEHDEIDPLLASVGEGLASLSGDTLPSDAADRRAALVVRISAARDSLGRHLAHEETDALVILQRHLTPTEFEVLHKDASAGMSVGLGFIVPWLAEDLPADAREHVLREAGVPMRVLLRLTRGRFRRQERAAFRFGMA